MCVIPCLIYCIIAILKALCQVKGATKMQLDLWGLDYFDLFLVHFPIALAYVEPEHRYPPEWWGDDGKVHLRTFNHHLPLSFFRESLRLLMP